MTKRLGVVVIWSDGQQPHAIPLCGRHLGWSTVHFAHSSDDGDAAVVSQLLNFVETCARVEGQWRNVRVGFQVGEAVNTVAP